MNNIINFFKKSFTKLKDKPILVNTGIGDKFDDMVYEISRKHNLDIIPPLNHEHQGPIPNSMIGVCGQCGRIIRIVMRDSCSNKRCPTGLGDLTSYQ